MIKNNNYIVIQGWMTKLGLSGNKLLVYAIVFGFCQDKESVFAGSVQYIANWLNTTERTAKDVLGALCSDGLLTKSTQTVKGVDFNVYKINAEKTKDFYKEKNSTTGGQKTCPPSENFSKNQEIFSKNQENFSNALINIYNNNILDGDNNACACARENQQHQQILEKSQPYEEFFLSDEWVRKLVALWNIASEGRSNWLQCDFRHLETRSRERIKKRAIEFYNRYKNAEGPSKTTKETLAESLIRAAEERYSRSDTYQGKTKGRVKFSIQKVFTDDKDWYTFLDCLWVQR